MVAGNLTNHGKLCIILVLSLEISKRRVGIAWSDSTAGAAASAGKQWLVTACVGFITIFCERCIETKKVTCRKFGCGIVG